MTYTEKIKIEQDKYNELKREYDKIKAQLQHSERNLKNMYNEYRNKAKIFENGYTHNNKFSGFVVFEDYVGEIAENEDTETGFTFIQSDKSELLDDLRILLNNMDLKKADTNFKHENMSNYSVTINIQLSDGMSNDFITAFTGSSDLRSLQIRCSYRFNNSNRYDTEIDKDKLSFTIIDEDGCRLFEFSDTINVLFQFEFYDKITALILQYVAKHLDDVAAVSGALRYVPSR